MLGGVKIQNLLMIVCATKDDKTMRELFQIFFNLDNQDTRDTSLLATLVLRLLKKSLLLLDINLILCRILYTENYTEEIVNLLLRTIFTIIIALEIPNPGLSLVFQTIVLKCI